VTGRKAFEGKDAVESLNKIIREPVAPISELILPRLSTCKESSVAVWQKTWMSVIKPSKTSR